ncbi:MAG: exodeoxyribonuclease VII large subunit [Acidobacteria bacterium]|nr:MAG: exodeoxyribonuclease VII large subunit [Acidobacteriota bacterium]
MDDSQFSFEFTAETPSRHIYGVRELVATVRTHLENGFPDVWVLGEISNYRPAESGHLYFTLKDGDSQLRVVIFRAQARLLRFRPQNGMQITARGRVTMYEARGEVQLLAEYMEPMGAGALQVAFEQLKQKLAAEGLFAPERKKALPSLPRRIGVVTSPRGAVIQDILNVLRRRHESLNVLIYPAQVQGESAVGEVSAGVRYFNERHREGETAVDVIIVARGGGSVEDLAAFNSESLARTIAASRIPVISAVGHETDFTICDFVADLRAPTPSAAAEIVIRSKQELQESVFALSGRLRRAIEYKLLSARQSLMPLEKNRVFARMEDAIARRQQRVDDLHYRLESLTRARLGDSARRFELAASRLRQQDLRRQLKMRERELLSCLNTLFAAAQRTLTRHRSRLEQAYGKLAALSPVAILERGYSLIFDANGVLIKDASQLAPGDSIRARLARGELKARVEALSKARRS